MYTREKYHQLLCKPFSQPSAQPSVYRPSDSKCHSSRSSVKASRAFFSDCGKITDDRIAKNFAYIANDLHAVSWSILYLRHCKNMTYKHVRGRCFDIIWQNSPIRLYLFISRIELWCDWHFSSYANLYAIDVALVSHRSLCGILVTDWPIPRHDYILQTCFSYSLIERVGGIYRVSLDT